MKSAADAAAGAVYLPNDGRRPPTALDEAQKNGYIDVARGPPSDAAA
jgi:hypothetical protein